MRRRPQSLESRVAALRERHAAENAADIKDEDLKVRCAHCGCRGEEHKASTGTCPATIAWASPKKFPSFRQAGKSPEADARLDRALARYWKSPNRFKPMR